MEKEELLVLIGELVSMEIEEVAEVKYKENASDLLLIKLRTNEVFELCINKE